LPALAKSGAATAQPA